MCLDFVIGRLDADQLELNIRAEKDVEENGIEGANIIKERVKVEVNSIVGVEESEEVKSTS